jgi:glycyl-tRNA synthetase beta chain
MTKTADFLVEIGTEELPPKALPGLERAFAEAVLAGVRNAGLGGSSLHSFATPRRLAVSLTDVALTQPPQRIEKRGPPLKAAFDTAGEPTRAATAFAESCGCDVAALETVETPAGAWLAYRGDKPGQPAAGLLPEIVRRALDALPAPKRMRWGSRDIEFVRPVHWVVMLLNEEIVPAEILGLKAGNHTRGHRYLCSSLLKVARPAEYASTLRKDGKVIAGFDERRQSIRALAEAAARELGGTAIMDAGVLDEVTALVEWPVPITGQFDETFLRLPEEVLMATLQGHQRYFPVRAPSGKLLANFITISNLESREPEQVRRGNERVVRPRLADAAFFWDQDSGATLDARRSALKDVIFQRGLGSLHDKSARIETLGRHIAAAIQAPGDTVGRAAQLAKTDLLTEMVKEFPELQGRIGYHYALRDGEGEAVAKAIEEHYLPRHASDQLAATSPGRCLALADRLDTLAGTFLIGKKPTGNKDPFGLRRAALGLLRTLIELRIDLSLDELIHEAIAGQPARVTDQDAVARELRDFIVERLKAWYLDGQAPGFAAGEITTEMFEAVRVRAPRSPLDFHERLQALRAFLRMQEAQSLAVANKRIANILRGATDELPAKVDPALFDADEEHRLHNAVTDLLPLHESGLAGRRYGDVLRQLAALRDPVDAFFTAVLVMTDEAPRRRNRLAQLQRLRHLFLDVADLSCLPAP